MDLDLYITANPILCQPGGFLRWKRRHHRPCIQKKWRRFGAVFGAPCSGHGYMIAGQMVACPCYIAKMKAAIKRADDKRATA